MDPLTVLLAYFLTWVEVLKYTLGAPVIALAFVYFTRTFAVGRRIAVPVIVGAVVSIIGTGEVFLASSLPQLGYHLCLLALGSGCAISYLAVTGWTKRGLGWVMIIVCSHLAAYTVLFSLMFIPLIGKSIFGLFAASVLFCAIFCGIATWCLLHRNPK
ncbi:MAG: hypothetical protein LBU24_02410 [Methanocalculaceae archaeon]|jgi:hypothetical protein|nr:hypothetical protein [Methanocalculaceae archaeon]